MLQTGTQSRMPTYKPRSAYAGVVLLALLDLAWFHLFLCRKGMSTYDWVVTQRSLPPHKQCAPALECLQLARGQTTVRCSHCITKHPKRNAVAAEINYNGGDGEDPEGGLRHDDIRGGRRMSAALPDVCRRASGKVLPLASEDPTVKTRLPCAKEEDSSAPGRVPQLAESDNRTDREGEADRTDFARTDSATYDHRGSAAESATCNHRGSGTSLIQAIFRASGFTDTSRPPTPPCNTV